MEPLSTCVHCHTVLDVHNQQLECDAQYIMQHGFRYNQLVCNHCHTYCCLNCTQLQQDVYSCVQCGRKMVAIYYNNREQGYFRPTKFHFFTISIVDYHYP